MQRLSANLQNTYYLMRHGQSIANQEGIIISLPENGCSGAYGLSEVGRRQVVESVTASELSSDTLIYTSDFSRARQTAELASVALNAASPIIAPELRERCFGELEFESSCWYEEVWRADLSGRRFGRGVEDMTDVADRVTRFIDYLGQMHYGRAILLVSHGDTLQAAQVAARQLHPARNYNVVAYMENAEIKQL